MNTFKRKALVANVTAALQTAAWFVLGPVNKWYYNRSGLVLRDGPGEIKELERSITEKFKEIKDNVKRHQDAVDTAIDQIKRGDEVHAKTADELKAQGEKSRKDMETFQAELKKLGDRFLEMEQKEATREKQRKADEQDTKTAGELFVESDAYKEMMTKQGKDPKRCDPVEISRKAMQKTAIFTPFPVNQSNDWVTRPDRVPGIVMPGLRRFTIRDLLPSLPTSSNVVEYVSELVFTNAAAPQGSGASPDGTEGNPKAESALSFQLNNAIIITLAHWIPASKQVMSDAPYLAAYINARLTYGLKLEEENELLTGDGTSGKLNGVNNQATAFAGGATNQTGLDTLLKAMLQVSLSFFETTGIILHPTDWTGLQLLKDTLGRYLFADPTGQTTPRVWGKNVVPTVAQTLGQFTAGAFDLGGAILDREGVSIRVSDQHSDFFTRNMIAILCEERVGFVMFRPAAFVKGALNTPG